MIDPCRPADTIALATYCAQKHEPFRLTKDWCCLWLRPRDMAKIGQLVLDRGCWNGARVVSENWIDTATAPQIKTIYDGLYYGYQFWLGASSVSGRQVNWFAAHGQGGQRIFIVPTLDIVAVVTAGNYCNINHGGCSSG
jgi:hypothetical protein